MISSLDTWLGNSRKRRLAVGCTGLGLFLISSFTLGYFLAGGGGGSGGHRIIVAELAGNGGGVWARESFLWALMWDVPYIVIYVASLVLAARALMPFYRVRLLRTKGPNLVTAVIVAAGLFDLVEDAFLAVGVGFGPTSSPAWPFLWAAVFAISKFALLVAALLILSTALVAGFSIPSWLFKKLYEDAATGKVDNKRVATMNELAGFVNEVGLCFSGGGVRAASLTLGSLQELERGPRGRIDPTLGWSGNKRITAVSGGAYMAGAWQLGRAYRTDAWQAEDSDGKASSEEEHLLRNLGYLASTWSRGHRGDLGAPKLPGQADEHAERLRSGASVWATIFTGFVFNLMVIASALLLMVIAATVVMDELVDITGPCELRQEIGVPRSCVVAQSRFWLPPVFWLAMGALTSALWVWVSKMRTLRKDHVWVLKAFKGATRGMLALGLALSVLLLGFPYLVQVVYRWDWQGALGALAGLAGALTALVRVLVKRSAPLAAKLGGVAFIALLVLASGWLAVRILELRDRPDSKVFWAMIIVPAVVLFAAWLVRPELWSLNAFYRGKLRIAYAVRRLANGRTAVAYVNDADATAVAGPPPDQTDQEGGPDSDNETVAEPNLSDLSGHTPLTICAAAHVTTRGVAAHYGIPAMSFTFTPEMVRTYVPQDDEGRFEVIECATEDLQACYSGAGRLNSGRITTMFAVALAGAAVAPAMGRFQIGPTSALITFGNVRLGAWLPNPRYVNKGAAQSARDAGETKALRQDRFPKARLSYLVKEFCGIHDPSDPYVYVSDGGHWENTGLVELLRTQRSGDRMPREVIAIDADPGNPGSVHQLSSAIDLARLECGVHIHIDLDPVRAFAAEPGGPAYARRSVALGVMKRGTDWGLLWYGKPVLSKDSPTPLLAHREIDAEFPHTTTVDQFFDTSTYVAYRDLGRFNAREIKQGRTALKAVLAGPGSGVPDRVTEPYPGSWAVEDFRRLLQDFQEVTDQLVEGAREALAVSRPTGG